MKFERLSIKAVTAGILLLLGICSVSLSYVSIPQYRDAALVSQSKSLSRMLEISARKRLQDMETDLDRERARLALARAEARVKATEKGK